MEKLGIHILAADLVEHLYNWNNGFGSLAGRIVCPATDVIHLTLTSVRSYQIKCSDALLMTESGDRSLRSITIGWKNEAGESRTDHATFSLIDPNKPNNPSVISVEMGTPSIQIEPAPATRADSMPDADNRAGVAAMLADVTDRLFLH